MSTLYELSAELARLDDMLAAADDANAHEVQALLAMVLDLASQREKKIDSYCGLIAEIEARGAARKAEADRLYARAKVCENAVKALKQRMLEALDRAGIKKVETERFTVTVADNGGRQAMELDERRRLWW